VGSPDLSEQQEHRRQLVRLGRLLQELRREAGLRQVDIAERLGRSQSYVTKYESGERRLDLYELQRVCDATGVSLEECLHRFKAGGGRGG
jgi:transcriptional regulator with XRE-family HTH domain